MGRWNASKRSEHGESVSTHAGDSAGKQSARPRDGKISRSLRKESILSAKNWPILRRQEQRRSRWSKRSRARWSRREWWARRESDRSGRGRCLLGEGRRRRWISTEENCIF